MNSHLTTKRLKHPLNFESVENVRQSWNVVEFELHHLAFASQAKSLALVSQAKYLALVLQDNSLASTLQVVALIPESNHMIPVHGASHGLSVARYASEQKVEICTSTLQKQDSDAKSRNLANSGKVGIYK